MKICYLFLIIMIQILFVRSNEIQIKNCQDLLELKVENMNKDSKIKLMNDIDCEVLFLEIKINFPKKHKNIFNLEFKKFLH